MTREHVSNADLVGHLGQKPELSKLEDGTPYIKLSLATSERYTDRSGDIRERTEWHRATAWGPVAEKLAATNLDKGDSVTIAGTLRINSYAANGVQHRVSEIEIREAQKNLENVPSRNESRLVGVVREEPKVKHLESGTTLTTISLATKTIVNGKEREDWHSITAWGKTAEAAAREVNVGDTVAINGPLRHRSVPGENGQERKLSAIETSKFQVLERALDRSKELKPPAPEQAREKAQEQKLSPPAPEPTKTRRTRAKGLGL
jgi:single stranded DNA-binding protein